MEKITETLKGTTEKVVSSGKTIVSKTMNLQAKDIGKKIFDNMIWVMVLIGVMILVYISYMLTQSFNIDAKIKSMNQEYKFERKISLDAPSESGNEQSFDEIKMDKHTLCDVFICSSAKSYLAGRQIFDFVSKEMFFQNVKLGARYVELDLFEDGKGNIVVSNGLFKGNWMLTLNSIYFEDFCKDISTKVFNSEYTSNYQDPFLIYLGLNLSKDKMNLVARIIKNTIEKHLVGSAYSQKGDKNILDETLDRVLSKIVLITDGKIGNTDMLEYIHLRIGNRVRRITYTDYKNEDQEKMKNFNKTHFTIVTPDPDISSMNYSVDSVFEGGCQVIALNFQYVGDHMRAYLSKFHEKSFILKPFEFTKFSDIPQKGYDPNKIAYYENYEILSEKNQDGTTTDASSLSLSNDYNRDADSIFFKNNIGYEKPFLKHGCCNIFLEDSDLNIVFPESDLDVSTTNMLKKLHEFNEQPDNNFNIINEKNKEDIIRMLAIPSLTSTSTLQQIRYYILKKQLSRLLQSKREEIFKAGMKDPCHGLDDKCSSNPMCFFKPYDLKINVSAGQVDTIPTNDRCSDGRVIYQKTRSTGPLNMFFSKRPEGASEGYNKYSGTNLDVDKICNYTNDSTTSVDGYEKYSMGGELTTQCESSLSSIPYPKLCLPKYISNNRNVCLSSSKDKTFIDSQGIRTIFHEKMTQPGFSGKWNSYLGQITIPNEFDNQCEFKFTTKFDRREYSLFIVNHQGEYYKFDSSGNDNFITEDNTYKLRAKGTFIDPALRDVEKRNKLPTMPYHGYVEIKMDDYSEEATTADTLRECLNNKFIGIYRYSEKVYADKTILDSLTNVDEKKIKKLYSTQIEKMFDNYDVNGMILGYNQPLTGNETSNNIFCYKVLSNECLDQLPGPAISFEREEPPSFIYAPAESVLSAKEVSEMTESIGLTFTEEELEEPGLRKRVIGMVRGKSPQTVQEFEERAQVPPPAPPPVPEPPEEIAKKADIFIYHTTNKSSDTIKKPGDTFQISGIDDQPFCIQRKVTDIRLTECSGGKCDASIAYIAECKNTPDMQDPFCENIDAAHNIQFEDDGTEGDNRTQKIRSLNIGDPENQVDACLSYNDKGDVLYSHCDLEKNEDSTINNRWKVYRLDGEDNFRLASVDNKCLTRVPYEGKEPDNLVDGLYEKDDMLGASFASTKMMDCSEENKLNQRFNIKYMGDTQNCVVANDIPKIPKVDMNKRTQEKLAGRKDAEGNSGSMIMKD